MTENSTPTGKNQGIEFNRIIAVMIAVLTLLTAVVAYLQSDASGQDDQANRDGMRYMLEAFGNQVSGDARVNFDYNVAYQAYYEYSLLASSTANRDNLVASDNYTELAGEVQQLSPMLADPYFDEENGPNVAQYEADTYLVKTTGLLEKFVAASAVKDAWDNKANTYVVHLTLLAVALFLFGLSTAISNSTTRWVFAGGGTIIAIVAIVWAAVVFAKPVFDLRQQGDAIDQYATGVGMAHQERYEDAIGAFDQALAAYPQYANALAERANAEYALGNYEQAIADFEAALASGDQRSSTIGMLAYQYHLTGDFEKAIAMDRKALTTDPEELWLQFDLGLNLLANGQNEESQTVYRSAIQAAAAKVSTAKEAGEEAPSYVWYGLSDGAAMLDNALYALETGEGIPPADKIANPDEFIAISNELLAELKSSAAALEYTGVLPQGDLAATISPFAFVVPETDENGDVSAYSEPSDEFEYGIDEFVVQFDYSGMTDGEDYLFKLYIDGVEDPSWRILQPWDLGSDGYAEIPVSYAYSDTFVFEPGEYVVELYVNYQLAQRGSFSIIE